MDYADAPAAIGGVDESAAGRDELAAGVSAGWGAGVSRGVWRRRSGGIKGMRGCGWASGRTIAFGLIVAGIVLPNMWLLIMGAFVLIGARMEDQGLLLQSGCGRGADAGCDADGVQHAVGVGHAGGCAAAVDPYAAGCLSGGAWRRTWWVRCRGRGSWRRCRLRATAMCRA